MNAAERRFPPHISRPKRVALAIACGVLLHATLTEARPTPRRGGEFVANKSIGLGLMLGAPTGLTGKYFLSRDTALDFGIGNYYTYRGDEYRGLHVFADFLWHPVVLTKQSAFWLPLYIGVGGRFIDHGDRNHSHLGVRAPLGISFDFQRTPLDIFVELSLAVDLVAFEDDRDHGATDVGGAVGIRYYF